MRQIQFCSSFKFAVKFGHDSLQRSALVFQSVYKPLIGLKFHLRIIWLLLCLLQIRDYVGGFASNLFSCLCFFFSCSIFQSRSAIKGIAGYIFMERSTQIVYFLIVLNMFFCHYVNFINYVIMFKSCALFKSTRKTKLQHSCRQQQALVEKRIEKSFKVKLSISKNCNEFPFTLCSRKPQICSPLWYKSRRVQRILSNI